jgi:exonuclease VII large subunit
MTIQDYKDTWEENPSSIEGTCAILKGTVAHPTIEQADCYFAVCDSSGAINICVSCNLLKFAKIKKLEQGDYVSVFGKFESTYALKPSEIPLGYNRLYLKAGGIEILCAVEIP